MKRKTSILLLLSLLAANLFSCNTTPENNTQETTSSESLEGKVDVFLFMGQSNMGGRGYCDIYPSVKCEEGHGYEYRAVTDPNTLHPMEEPFGEKENRTNGINDGTKKSGSMASSFSEYYYRETGVPVIGISASQGGTKSSQWLEGGGRIEDAAGRLSSCLQYLETRDDMEVRHINMLWIQGEADSSLKLSDEEIKIQYIENVSSILSYLQEFGVEKCFVMKTGGHSTDETKNIQHHKMGNYQQALCDINPDCVMVSWILDTLPVEFMHLDNHFMQPAYNILGKDAAINTAHYILTGEDPICKPYDPEINKDPAYED